MSTKPLTLKGVIDVEEDNGAEELRRVRLENQRLDEALRSVRNELGEVEAKRENLERGIRALRNQLSPLYRALRAVFGEIELAVGEEEDVRTLSRAGQAPTSANGTDPRWESYKQNFPGVAARMIDALLVQPEMNLVQLSAFLKVSYDTAKGASQKLLKAGAVARHGKMLRLNR